MSARDLDLFVAHGWRFHPEWQQVVDALDQTFGRQWRNFSLPWHDPAIQPSTPQGRELLEASLRGQILPARAILIPAALLREGASSRVWVEFELAVGRELGIPSLLVDLNECDGPSTSAPVPLHVARCDLMNLEMEIQSLLN